MLKLFGNIKEVAEHAQSFVIILIDEVESIAYARDTVSGNLYQYFANDCL